MDRGVLAAFVGTRRVRARAAAGIAAAAERHRRLAAAMHTHQVASEIVERIDLDPAGVADGRVPAGERLYFVIDGVSLVEPGPEQGTSAILAEDGQLIVSNRALRFRSRQTEVQWPLDRLTGQSDGRRWVMWTLADREAVKGVGGSRAAAVAARAGALWSHGRIAEAWAYLTSVVEQTQRELDAIRAEPVAVPKPRKAKVLA